MRERLKLGRTCALCGGTFPDNQMIGIYCQSCHRALFPNACSSQSTKTIKDVDWKKVNAAFKQYFGNDNARPHTERYVAPVREDSYLEKCCRPRRPPGKETAKITRYDKIDPVTGVLLEVEVRGQLPLGTRK